MRIDFGFEPVSIGKRYCICYMANNAEWVGQIARQLYYMGIPLWYDSWEEKGREWERQISRNISKCLSLILFSTKEVFSSEGSFVEVEVDTAIELNKTIYVVWLDSFSSINDVCFSLRPWYTRVSRLKGIDGVGKTSDIIARMIVDDFHLTQGRTINPSKSSVQSNITSSSIAEASERNDYAEEQDACVNMRLEIYVGEQYEFGRYPQGKNGEVEPLIWRVLKVKNGNAFLITEKLIDRLEFKESEFTKLLWEKYILKDRAFLIIPALLDGFKYLIHYGFAWKRCMHRKWLNNYFFNTAFNNEEKSRIIETKNENLHRSRNGRKHGKITLDRVFFLSEQEAAHDGFFRNDAERMATTTPYAREKKGCETDWSSEDNKLSNGEKTERWWLRSRSISNSLAIMFVNYDGKVDWLGGYDFEDIFVRPALWIKI